MTAGADWFEAYNAVSASSIEALARTLRRDPAERYAMAPFTPLKVEGQWFVAAIVEPPPGINLASVLNWQPEGDVILIDPKTGAMSLHGDGGAALVEPYQPVGFGAVHLYTNGIVFARDWAAARADWIQARRDNPLLAPSLSEPTGQPGIALCGDFRKVADLSPLRRAERVDIDDPRMIRPVTQALLKAARLPDVNVIRKLKAVA